MNNLRTDTVALIHNIRAARSILILFKEQLDDGWCGTFAELHASTAAHTVFENINALETAVKNINW